MREGKHHAPEDSVYRQISAQRQQKRATRQNAQHESHAPAPAERSQGQGDHAGTHVQVVRQGDVLEARLRDPSRRGLEPLAVTHAVRSNELDQSNRVKRVGLGIGPRKRTGTRRRALECVRRHQSDRAHPCGQSRSECKHAHPASAKARTRQIATALKHFGSSSRGQRKAHAHHGHEDFPDQQAAGGRQCRLDRAHQPTATAPPQAIEQRQMTGCCPGHPRTPDHAHARSPLTGVVASQRPGQGRHAGRDRRADQSSRHEEHPHAAPHKMGKVLPGHQACQPVRRHNQVKPVGRIEDAIERISKDGKPNSLKGVPARPFPAQQRIAHQPARR